MPPAASAQAPGPADAPAPLMVALIPVLNDNYVFALHDGRRAAVVDPAIPAPAATAATAAAVVERSDPQWAGKV